MHYKGKIIPGLLNYRLRQQLVTQIAQSIVTRAVRRLFSAQRAHDEYTEPTHKGLLRFS